jgi:hypothetical protein
MYEPHDSLPFTTSSHWSLSWAIWIQSTSYHLIYKFRFNTILPTTPMSSKWSHLLRFQDQIFLLFLISPMCAHALSISFTLTSSFSSRRVQIMTLLVKVSPGSYVQTLSSATCYDKVYKMLSHSRWRQSPSSFNVANMAAGFIPYGPKIYILHLAASNEWRHSHCKQRPYTCILLRLLCECNLKLWILSPALKHFSVYVVKKFVLHGCEFTVVQLRRKNRDYKHYLK